MSGDVEPCIHPSAGEYALADEIRKLTAEKRELEERISKLTAEIKLRQHAVNKWVPCPDHRDKTTNGRCYVCSLESAESKLQDAQELLRQIRDGLVNPEDEADKFLRDHKPSKLQEVQRQLGECSGGYQTLQRELQEVRGELERERNQFCIENERLRGELDSALDEGRKRIRLLEQKNQALEEANKQLLEFRNGKVGPEIL